MWLRVNRLSISRDTYLERLRAEAIEATPSVEVDSAVCLAVPKAVSDLPGFADGCVSVQDAAAQLAASYLDLAPGQRVLDACAAPGGKTGHILERCPDIGQLFALDRDAERLALVADNLERLRLRGARLVHADATRPEDWWDGQPFDRILIDAPCTAVGVIRRHPDIKVLRRSGDVEQAVQRQDALIASLWPLLAPGGRLVYATCSVLRCENAERLAGLGPRPAEDLVARNSAPTVALVPSDGLGERLESADIPRGERQVLPGEAQMDGFYYAWLVKSETLQVPGVCLTQQ
jgi:16S rRNA (cytosine967-C5)-methyltransferase